MFNYDSISEQYFSSIVFTVESSCIDLNRNSAARKLLQ